MVCVARALPPRHGQDQVACFDSRLEQVSSFHTFDPRVMKYAYWPSSTLATYSELLLVLEPFSPAVVAYRANGRPVGRYVLSHDAERFNQMWGEVLTEADRRRIRETAHHFTAVFGVTEGALLRETWRAGRVARYAVLEPEQGVFRYVEGPFLGGGSQKMVAVGALVGAYSGGVIWSISPAEVDDELGRFAPELRQLARDPLADPALLLLDLDTDERREQ